MSNLGEKIIKFPQTTDDPMEAAIEWQAYLYSGQEVAAGRDAFQAWLKESSKNHEAYQKIEQYWQDMDYAVVGDAELDAEADRHSEAVPIETKWSFRRKWQTAISIAASLLVVFIGGQFLDNTPNIGQKYATSVGEVKTVKLEDGSKITLSGASSMMVNITEQERNVTLIDGQAFFNVARDETRWFKVKVGTTEVSVLGTAFDIQKNHTEVRIAVISGLVEVKTLPNEKDTTPVQEVKKLKKGDMIYSSLDGRLGERKSFDEAAVMSWQDGRLEYNKVPLIRVVEEVNRYRSQKIILKDSILADIPISISFKTSETDKLLTGLALLDGVKVVKGADTILIHQLVAK